jgi:hypothetical protein
MVLLGHNVLASLLKRKENAHCEDNSLPSRWRVIDRRVIISRRGIGRHSERVGPVTGPCLTVPWLGRTDDGSFVRILMLR